ncbi:MAG: CheY-like chemotaxis protein [Crocinitomix sp.]|jgi:CheY-like chemotaxis protein
MKSHVILIDDNPVDNIIHEQMLRSLNQEIDISIIDNGTSALELLKQEFSQNLPDTKTTIFLDEQMPDLKGLEIMETLEELDLTENSNIQVYFLTTDMSLRLIEKTAIMPNVRQVIQKPLTVEFLAYISL